MCVCVYVCVYVCTCVCVCVCVCLCVLAVVVVIAMDAMVVMGATLMHACACVLVMEKRIARVEITLNVCLRCLI